MTAEQKRLVQQSWTKIVPYSDRTALLFYDRLFEIRPKLRALFPADMTEQWRKLMLTIGVAVESLDDLRAVVPDVQAMGRRHATYGVAVDDYAPVGTALLWALEKTLGTEWTPEMAKAWGHVYTLLAETMIDAAAGA